VRDPVPALRQELASLCEGQDGKGGDRTSLELRDLVRSLVRLVHRDVVARGSLLQAYRQRDQTVQQLAGPPAGAMPGGGARVEVQMLNLLSSGGGIVNQERQVLSLWPEYQERRLKLHRALGTRPAGDWAAFLRSLSAEGTAEAPR